jgi:DNA-binding CsgD family transcriptional regulator
MTEQGTVPPIPTLEALSPMALQVHRAAGPVVGRQAELDAIRQELAIAKGGRLSSLALEGEPGIGKTRLLIAGAEIARAEGFLTIAVTADEELRGPFLLARSIVGSPEAARAADARPELAEALTRCLDAMSGRDDPSLAALPPDHRVLRTFDLGAVAFQALVADQPLAVLIDDLQWSDDDSLRLLRYVVRSAATCPILLLFAIRPEELALAAEATNLLADMDRMGLVRRLPIDRLLPHDARELLASTLGGPVDPNGAAVMHAQAEGVPFILEEMIHAYRDGGMLQQVDGVWRLQRNAERLVPSAVRTLIARRAARVPDVTKELLADAAVLGRHFSLKDLREVELRVNDGAAPPEPDELAGALEPAVTAGLLVAHPEGSAADYTFQHEQVREVAAGHLTAARRRAIHEALIELLMAGEPSPASLPLLAHHAKAAGDGALCVRFSVEASRNALAANAPEEVLRVVELALPSAASAQERLDLLEARDRAFDMLRRPNDRLEGLAEIAALAEALGASHLELDTRLRRAAALRTSEEFDRAAELAGGVRQLAQERGDREAELAACMELGQDLVRAAAGEAFGVPEAEIDIDAAEEAFGASADLARELGDEVTLAYATRELGLLRFARLVRWIREDVAPEELLALAKRVTGGEELDAIIRELPIAPLAEEAQSLLEQALEIFERIGDRRGAMASIITMAYLNWAPDIQFGSGAGRHIEGIRRLTSKAKTFTNESERAAFEAQLLYGVHVFALAKVIPDLAIARGEQAHAQARELGERSLEFLAAGGTAMALIALGETEPARGWVEKAAAVAAEHPTPLRTRRLETWRGLLDAAAGDAAGMREHLERAVQLAIDSGFAAARCEAMAHLALEGSRLGVELGDGELLALAERSAREVRELAAELPGHPPWGAQAGAALARVALARGQIEEAAGAAGAAMGELQEAKHEDLHLGTLLPLAQALAAAQVPEWEMVRGYLELALAMIAQRTADEDVRVRWFRGPIGRELTQLVGPIAAAGERSGVSDDEAADEADAALLRGLVEGKTNREIAEDLGTDEATVTRRLGELYARVGVSSRAEATAFAFRDGSL